MIFNRNFNAPYLHGGRAKGKVMIELHEHPNKHQGFLAST